MIWNWQLLEWPNFTWDRARMAAVEDQFLLRTGVVIGTARHLQDADRQQLLVEVMSCESMTTSEIEGEILNRASVQSSVQRHLGLATNKHRATPAEQGIAEMMVDLHRRAAEPLTEATLFHWHELVTAGRRDLTDVGCYRTDPEPMQVISGAIGRSRVHFEAPPATRVPKEMQRFLRWFNQNATQTDASLSTVTRAGIAHLYFECIHPFEDGNGRIGRAVAEKALAQSFDLPILVSLATTILAHQKGYYEALERANKGLDLTEWLEWFSAIALEAQEGTLAEVEFLIAKTQLFDRLRGKLNERQQKALLRLFREGPKGFEGGLSASNYATITGSSPATTTRDLADLVEKDALTRTGENKYARYKLNV
jgi:Fic family protein